MGNTSNTHHSLKYTHHPINYSKNHNPNHHSIKLSQNLYFIKFQKKQLHQENFIYLQRIQIQKIYKHLINILHYQILNQSNCCCDPYIQLQIQPYIKLSYITTNQMQTLYVLINVLKGFRELYNFSRLGFEVNSEMIGVNNDGEIRVWINENFEENNFNGRVIKNNEEIIVKSILNMIEMNRQKYKLPNDFSNYKQCNLKQYNFESVLYLIEEFKDVNKFRIPNKIQSLIKYQAITKQQKNTIHKKNIHQIPSSQLHHKSINITSRSPLLDITPTNKQKSRLIQVQTANFSTNQTQKNSIDNKYFLNNFIKSNNSKSNSIFIYEPSDNLNSSFIHSIRQMQQINKF